MAFLEFLKKPYPQSNAQEVKRLLDELVRIGIQEDYLSEFPGRGFNAQCRNIRAREIGIRMGEIGGNELMSWAFRRVRKQAGKPLPRIWSTRGEISAIGSLELQRFTG
jgi:hypothetical protein